MPQPFHTQRTPVVSALALLIGLLPLKASAQAAIEVATGNLDGHSYSLIRTESGTRWVDARQYCEAAGGHLATITSAAENELLATMLDTAIADGFACFDPSYAWINTWFGLFEEPESEGSWQWVTGEPFAFTHWGPGEPNNSGPDEDLGMMFCPDTGKRGQWNDATSIDPEHPGSRQFFCEFAEACQYAPPGQPVRVQRTAGPPNVVEVVWDSCGGPGVLTVEGRNVSSAVVTLNFQVVAAPSGFHHAPVLLQVPVTLLAGENLLRIELRGKPGTSLDLSFAEN